MPTCNKKLETHMAFIPDDEFPGDQGRGPHRSKIAGGHCPPLKAAATEARPTDARKAKQELGKKNGVPTGGLGNERKVAGGQQRQPPKVLSG